MAKIKVGVIGVGNCFSGLFQGIELYNTKLSKEKPIGLMNEEIGGYGIFDIDFVAAWDVGENKIGQALVKAIYLEPNLVNWVEHPLSTWWSWHYKTIVGEAPILDGIGIYVENKIKPLKNPTPIDKLRKKIIKEIKEKEVNVLVNYLPVGSQKATEFWADIALETECAFVNCIPVFIASDKKWEQKFREKNIPIIGDDIKGQVGATIVHRVLAKLVNDRGTKLEKTYQLNVGGNTDFLNMKEIERLESKKISKTSSVQSQLAKELEANQIHVGPSDFIPFLGNTKIAFIRLEGKMFAEIPYSMELRLEVDDKANSAGIVIDALRIAKLAQDRKAGGGNVELASAYLMKHPLVQYSDSEALSKLKEFLK